jgi:hypothetical protein
MSGCSDLKVLKISSHASGIFGFQVTKCMVVLFSSVFFVQPVTASVNTRQKNMRINETGIRVIIGKRCEDFFDELFMASP